MSRIWAVESMEARLLLDAVEGDVLSAGAALPASAGPQPQALTADVAPGQLALAAQAPDPWSLWSSGQTRLRGADIYQAPVWPEDGDWKGPGPVGPTFTQADFDALAAMGANYVNIEHPGLFTEKAPFVLDPGVQQNLDNLLAMVAQADMFAVISFRTGPGRSEFTFLGNDNPAYVNDTVWQDQAAQDAWAQMWRYTADRYRDNPIVVGYDLMVEPNSSGLLDIWDPPTFYAQYANTLRDWNRMYPPIVAAIRQVDAETPLLVAANGSSLPDWLPYIVPTGDLRTVYTIHQYDPHLYTHQATTDNRPYPGNWDVNYDNQPDSFNADWLNARLSIADTFTAQHGRPVAANEYGLQRWGPGGNQFLADQLQALEQHGLNHAIWSWNPYYEPWNSNVDGFDFRHGSNPNNHTDIPGNPLTAAIAQNWALNTVRPSNWGTPVNQAPDAVNDAATVAQDSTNNLIAVLANDTDPNAGDTLTVTAVGAAAHGTPALALGQVRYTPTPGYSGPDSFTYTISDGALTDTASVNVTVASTTDPVTGFPGQIILGAHVSGRGVDVEMSLQGLLAEDQALEQIIGRHIAFVNLEVPWNMATWPTQALADLATYDAVPMFNFKPWAVWASQDPAFSLGSIIAGGQDAYLNQVADALVAYGRPVIVSFACEMNANWFPWCGVNNGGSQTGGYGDPAAPDGPERYVDAYRHVVDRFRARGADQVIWVFQPNAYPTPDEAWNQADDYYPGDAYVDWLGVSVYGQQYAADDDFPFRQGLDATYATFSALAPGKPVMVSEWGRAEIGPADSKAAWIGAALTDLGANRWPNVRTISYWDEAWTNADQSVSDLHINSSVSSRDAYRAGVADTARFVDRWQPANALYVSTTGNDANTGTMAQPFRTIQYALDAATPGVTILVRGGTYNEVLDFHVSGTTAEPITLTGYPGETAILSGAALEDRYAIDLLGQDHLRIENLRITNFVAGGERGPGINADGGNDDIILRNLDIGLVGTVIKLQGATGEVSHNVVIENVTGHDYDAAGIDVGPFGSIDGLTIRHVSLTGPAGGNNTAVDGIAIENGQNIVIEDVQVIGHPGDGIDLKADHVIVRRAMVTGESRNGIKLWGTDVLVENSVAMNTGLTALVVKTENGQVVTLNNNLFGNAIQRDGYSISVGEEVGSASATVNLNNNIFTCATGNQGALFFVGQGTTLTGDYNLYYAPDRPDTVIRFFQTEYTHQDITSGAWSAAIGADQHALYANPLLTDPANGNFRPQAGSPAIDRAPAGPGVDIEGNARPAGAAYDVGPYEVGGSPSLSLSLADPAAVTEGDSGTKSMTFTASLSAAATEVVTVNWATADGTATTGNADYAAGSGTLTFSPGATTRTFSVLVNGDALVESDETFVVHLGGAGGAAIADGLAVATIQNDDAPTTTTVAFNARNRAVFTDADGDLVYVILRGPGRGEVTLPLSGQGDAIAVTVTDTTVGSSLVVVVRRLAGAGRTAIGNVTVTGPLAVLSAPTTDLAEDGAVAASDWLGFLQLNNVLGRGRIDVGAGQTARAITVILNQAVDLSFASLSPVRAFYAAQWADTDATPDRLTAPTLGSLVVRGNRREGLAGDFQADLRLQEADARGYSLVAAVVAGSVSQSAWELAGGLGRLAVVGHFSAHLTASWALAATIYGNLDQAVLRLTRPPDAAQRVLALGSLVVVGRMTNSILNALGHVGLVSVAGMVNSRLAAGVQDPAAALGDMAFLGAAGVRTVVIRGVRGDYGYVNSVIAATWLGTVVLRQADTANAGAGGSDFGLAYRGGAGGGLRLLYYVPRTGRPYVWPNRNGEASPVGIEHLIYRVV